MKKIVPSFLALLLLTVTLCSCSNSKLNKTTVSEVKEYLIQNDYYNDNNFQSVELGGIATFSGLMKNDWTIVFYDYADDEEAMDRAVPLWVSNIEITSQTKKSNYEIYECDSDKYSNYSLYVRVDNTFLMIFGPKDSKKEIIDLAKALGYYAE